MSALEGDKLRAPNVSLERTPREARKSNGVALRGRSARSCWAAEYNDPDNFLSEIFHSGSEYNYVKFSNAEFDKLVDSAARSNDPAKRQELYIQAERLLCETEGALIPIFHNTYNIP